MKNPRIEEASA
jgi:ubiquitin carboxyl-terminal hydrolase 36/42